MSLGREIYAQVREQKVRKTCQILRKLIKQQAKKGRLCGETRNRQVAWNLDAEDIFESVVEHFRKEEIQISKSRDEERNRAYVYWSIYEPY